MLISNKEFKDRILGFKIQNFNKGLNLFQQECYIREYDLDTGDYRVYVI